MRRLLLITILALACSGTLVAQTPYYPNEWITAGVKVAPGTGVTLCEFIETSGITTGHIFRMILSSQGLSFLVLEHMDSANTVAMRSHVYIVNASTYETNMMSLTLNEGERFRVRPYVAVGAALNVQCSLFVGL